MLYVDCSDKVRAELIAAEPILGAHILRIGEIKRPCHGELYSALVSSIVSQLISKKAAATVFGKLTELADGISPQNISVLSAQSIKECGMSFRKAESILKIANMCQNGEMNLELLNDMSDSDVVKSLSSLPGIGEWTAQMLMIFAMGRRDVISYKDLGIRRGMMAVYELESLSKKQFDEYAKLYSPNGSAASIYLWQLSDELTNTSGLAQLPK